MSGFVSAIFQPLRLLRLGFQSIPSNTALVKPDVFSVTSIRTNVRCHFPRPNEVKRVRKHGWKARLQTSEGRRIIMRRLLKGRYVLSH